MVAPFSSFWGNSILFVLVYIPINHAHELPSLSILISCYPLSTWSQSFWHMWGDGSLWFWSAFPWWLFMLSTFSWTSWTFEHILWKKCLSGPLPIFKLEYLLFCYWVVRVPYFFYINPLSDMWFTNIFLHSIGYLFCYFLSCTTEAFQFDAAYLFNFCFCFLYFWCHICKTMLWPMSKDFFPD